jgi:hypothetical protein
LIPQYDSIGDFLVPDPPNDDESVDGDPGSGDEDSDSRTMTVGYVC